MLRMLDEYQITPRRTLEIGCGTGTNAIELARRGFDVAAFDVSPLAIEQAIARARAAGVIARLMLGDALNPPELGAPFAFVFDRGVYHVLRQIDLPAFLRTLERTVAPGGLYLTLTGNANEQSTGQGPPRVQAQDICQELGTLFDVVQLREFRFAGVTIEGHLLEPLAWSALLRRKAAPVGT